MSNLPRLSLETAQARYGAAPESRLFAPLALAYRQQGQLAEAVRVLRAGLERQPTYVSAWVLLGICCREMQQEEEAETAFARVLELDAENLVALRYRAERARRRGAVERALELLRRALEIDPFDREVQADLGLLTAALERRVQTERATAEQAAAAAAPVPAPAPTAIQAEVPPAPVAPLPSFETPHPEPLQARHPSPDIPPPAIDLRRVGLAAETSPFVLPGTGEEVATGPSQPEHPASDAAQATPPAWRVTRDDDRIVVAPEGPPPVRGPIRSVEDRLWSEQRARAAGGALPPPAVPVPPGTPPQAVTARPAAPPPPAPAPAGPAGSEFATLTLARIYESQGYLQKALAIYEELQRRHPEDAEVEARLAALQRRLAAPATEPAAEQKPAVMPPPAAAAPLAAEVEPDLPVEWRLLDAKGLASPDDPATRLREKTHEVRVQQRARTNTFIGTPPPAPAAPEPPAAPREEDVSRGHPDFERFLSYVRSLRPPAEP